MVVAQEIVISIDEVYGATTYVSVIHAIEEKLTRLYLEHWMDLKDLRAHGYDILHNTHKCSITIFFK